MILSRKQAIDLVGDTNVIKVETMPCQPTNRVIYPSFEPEHVGMQEFCACLPLDDGCCLVAYYYLSDSDLVSCCDDISLLSWSVDHFDYLKS